MRALVGFAVFATALSFGVVEFYLSPLDRQSVLASLPIIGDAPRSADTAPKPTRASRRTFSPASPLFMVAVDKLAPKVVEAQRATVPEVVHTPSAPVLGWSTVVTMTAPSASNTEASHGPGLTPTDGNARYELAVNLLRELKRVGCYYGPLNGVWGTRAKDAMGEFANRVNARLSVDKPDYALLTLVRGHSAQVCDARCAPGEVIARDGRCLPSTVLAHGPAPGIGEGVASPPIEARRPLPPLPGRMAVGAPLPDRGLNIDRPVTGRSEYDAPGGHLDLAAATAAPVLDESLPATAGEGLTSARPPARIERRPPSWNFSRATRSQARRSSGALSRLPFNRRYIPPPRQLGQLR